MPHVLPLERADFNDRRVDRGWTCIARSRELEECCRLVLAAAKARLKRSQTPQHEPSGNARVNHMVRTRGKHGPLTCPTQDCGEN